MQYNKRGAVAVYSKNEEGTCDELVVDLYNRRFEYTGNLEEQELSGKMVGGIKILEVPQEFFRQLFDPPSRDLTGRGRAATWGRPYKGKQAFPVLRTDGHKIGPVPAIIIVWKSDILSLRLFHVT